MPDVRPEALKYIARGIYVLPLYGIDPATGFCRCPNGDLPCKSAGKHPLSSHAYHGSNDATLDPARVAEWPDDCNLGIKPTSTLVCLDFDEPDIVQRVLDLIDEDPEGSYLSVRTKRGVHIWVETALPLEKTAVLRNEKDLKLGDIKATGFLVTAPSAISGLDGGAYRWMGQSLADLPAPKVDGTAVDYAGTILTRLGVKLSKTQKGASWSAPVHHIPDLPGALPSVLLTDLFPDVLQTGPHVFVEADLRQLHSGTMPTNDRSDSLYKYGCEIWRAADRRGLTLDPLKVAGAVRELDARAYHKFAGRADQDVRFWELAMDSREAVNEEAAEDELKQARAAKREAKRAESNPTPSDTATEAPGGTSSPPPPGGLSHYWWDSVGGSFWFVPPKGTRGAARVLVCNFEPIMTELLTVWRDEAEPEVYTRVSFGGNAFLIEPSAMSDERAFRKAVTAALIPAPDLNVHHFGHLYIGMREYSHARGLIRESEAFAMTGFLQMREEPEFLLPGGSVTATGAGTAVYEDPTAPATFLRLGVEERPETSTALAALLQCASPTIVTALLAQTLGASLLSVAGKDWPRTVLHQWGHTGSFKTTLNRLFASVFGATSDTYPMTSWVSTLTALEQASHRARDLPVVFDDFKVSTLNRQGQQDIIRFLQNNADGTGKSRSTRDLRERKVFASRGLVLSSGEDPWSGQESIAARTVEVEAIEDPLEWQDRLATARDLPMDGIGFSWLRWCCQQGLETLHNELHWLKVEEQERTDETLHRRTAVSVAGLRAYSRVIQRWVGETFPEHATLVAEVFEQGWKEQGEEIAQQAVQAAAMAPFPDLVGIIREQILARRANLHPRLGQDNFYLPLSQGADPVGYHDEEFVYLTRGLTFTWFERLCHQTGRQIPYTWRAVNSGGKAMGAVPNVQIRVSNEVNPLRALRVPRNLFVDDALPDPSNAANINALIASAGLNPDPPDDDDDDLFRPRSSNK